jgi:ADP-ribose pyrophosphatase YjhB (NUDIX family)
VNEVWKPDVVVAALAERGGKFLLVEEETPLGVRLNQPAGHLEPGESLVEAVRREALEETARRFEPHGLVGVYRWPGNAHRPTFLRFAFFGAAGEPDALRPLDAGILRADWFSLDEIRARRAEHRSPLVLRCIEHYLAGHRASLDMLHECIEP